MPRDNRSDSITFAPHGCYRCKGPDRWCVIAVSNEAEWVALCQVMGHPDRTKEGRFSRISERKAHSEELDQFIEQWTIRKSPERVVELLQEVGIPAGVVQDAEDLANDQQLLARDFFVELDHPVLGTTFSDGSPIKFKNHRATNWKASPSLGDDNPYVYMDLLGMTENELSSYMEKGIVG